MRNMAKKRAPVTVVPVAIALPTAANSSKQMMCSERSLVFDDEYVTQMEIRKVANQTVTHVSNFLGVGASLRQPQK